MSVKIESTWNERLRDEFAAPYFRQLVDFVHAEYRQGVCYPPGRQIFNAFNLCPFDKVKVVILGQDPYHEGGPGGRSVLLRGRRRGFSPVAAKHL